MELDTWCRILDVVGREEGQSEPRGWHDRRGAGGQDGDSEGMLVQAAQKEGLRGGEGAVD